MTELGELIKGAAYWLLALITALAAWFFKKQYDRIDNLEAKYVTREELTKTLTEMKDLRIAQHQENRDSLVRIETKIDDNERRAANTRHDTRDQVHELALKLATIAARQTDKT
jgi:hypothetical protein